MVLEKKSKVCERLRNSGDCNNETDRQILIRKLIQLTLSRCMRSLKEKSFKATYISNCWSCLIRRRINVLIYTWNAPGFWHSSANLLTPGARLQHKKLTLVAFQTMTAFKTLVIKISVSTLLKYSLLKREFNSLNNST